MLRFSLCVLVGAAVVVGLAGCAPTSDVGASTVTGTVTLNGAPVEGATVSFVPADDAGKIAAGTTDAQGKFTLTTVKAGDGAVPGAYNVAISKVEGAVAAGGAMTEESRQASMPGAGRAPAPVEVKDLLPTKYKSAKDSGLTAEVKSGGGNDFTFTLEGEAKAK